MTKVSASILSANFARLGWHVRTAEEAGADSIHVDIMDGSFVPTISFGPMIIKVLRQVTGLPLEAHLMVSNPDQYIDECISNGASSVTIHAETATHLHRTLAHIRKGGVKAGVALNPATPLESLKWVLAEVDSVTVMTVNPGFAGQQYIESMTGKIRQIKNAAFGDTDVVVDGGVNATTAPLAKGAGATVLVAGSYVFGAADMKLAIDSLKQ